MAVPLRKRDLIKLSKKEFNQLIKKYKIKPKYKETKSDLINRIYILHRNSNKNQLQIKKKKNQRSKSQIRKQQNEQLQHKLKKKRKSAPPLLIQSSTDFTALDEVKDQQSNDDQHKNKSINKKDKAIKSTKRKPIIYQNQTFPESVNHLKNSSYKHKRNSSIIEIILQAPKKQYKINGIRSFNTIKEIKSGIPLKGIGSTQCKLFYEGKELTDNQTLSEIDACANTTEDTCKFKLKLKLKISWLYFKPNSKSPHPREMEHENYAYDKVSEMKKINNFKTFNALIGGLSRKYGIDINILPTDKQKILHEYCICLSGRKTYEKRWTKLHSLCYDYQNDIGMMVDLLKKHNIDIDIDTDDHDKKEDAKENLYIDAWPHSGNDTPLRMAINRAIPNKKEDKKTNKINAKGAVELVQFLVLNGARRMIRPTVVNLERTVNDQLYIGMDTEIRGQFVKILKDYVDEDPYRPIQNRSKYH